MAGLMSAMCYCYCIISITWSDFQNGGLHDEREQRKWFYGESFSFSGALPSKDTLVSQNFDNADQNRWHAVSLFMTASETSEKVSDFAAIIEEMFDCQSNPNFGVDFVTSSYFSHNFLYQRLSVRCLTLTTWTDYITLGKFWKLNNVSLKNSRKTLIILNSWTDKM